MRSSTVVGGLAIILTLAGAGKLVDMRMNQVYWNPDKFEGKTQGWDTINNENGRIWDDYVESGIPQNQNNWALYREKVSERNKGDLEGTIEVPVFYED